MTEMHLSQEFERALTIARIAMRFGQVRRVTLHEDSERESDTTHTVMLTLLGIEMAPLANCDPGVVAQFAAVHDLTETYAGDTNTARGLSPSEAEEKADREALAMVRLSADLHDSPVLGLLRRYEAQQEPEARLVRYLDKVTPELTHFLNRGLALAALGLTASEVREKHATQGAQLATQYPELASVRRLFEEACSAVEANVEHEETNSKIAERLRNICFDGSRSGDLAFQLEDMYRGEASNATAKQVESLSAEVARLTGEVAATQAEAKRQIDRAFLERDAAVASHMDRELIEADEALRSAVSKRFGPVALPRQLPLLLWFIVGYLGATAEAEVTDRLQEQHEPSQVNELKRQVIEQAAEINRLMGRTQMDANQSACSLDSQAMPINPKLGEVDHFPTDSKLLHLRAEAHRTATQLREFAGRSVWPVREALHSAASVVRDLIEAVGEGATALEVPPPTPAVAPEVRCTGCVTVRINKDRVIVKGQTWTSDDPNFKAWDVSLHDDDPRFGFGEPRGPEQRSRVGPTMELGARTGTWTWKGSMGGFGDIKWQGAWTAESKQATDVERLDYSRFPPGYSGETTTEDAWAEWKSKNDPPGFTVYHNGPTWLWQLDAADGAVGEAFEGTAAGAEDARCDAWKWYDRRLAIVSALDAMSKGGYSRANWPRCLTWSRVQVDEVERWLTDPEPFALLPVVLRG